MHDMRSVACTLRSAALKNEPQLQSLLYWIKVLMRCWSSATLMGIFLQQGSGVHYPTSMSVNLTTRHVLALIYRVGQSRVDKSVVDIGDRVG